MPQYCYRVALAALCLSLPLAVFAESGPSAEARLLIEELGLSEAPLAIADHPRWQPRRVVVMLSPQMGTSGEEYEAMLHAAAGGKVELVIDRSGNFVPAEDLLAGADALIGMCSPPAIKRADERLLWLHSYSVGMDHCARIDEASKQRIVFTNNKRLSGPAIAEHAMAMLLSLSRNLPDYHTAQAEGSWDRARAEGVSFGELRGKTLLVAGLGGIGSEIAWRAHGLGMRVIATRNSSREGPDFVAYVGLPDELAKLAAQADVVVNALPLTAQTQAVFNKDFFSAVKPGAIFLSVGRGKSTVTADLVAALQSGRLYGAGLDVTDPEPLPADHPLWQMPRVIITPHVSASGADSARRSRVIAAENLRRYVNGESLLNLVDMARGY